jgi:hypothetical protein
MIILSLVIRRCHFIAACAVIIRSKGSRVHENWEAVLNYINEGFFACLKAKIKGPQDLQFNIVEREIGAIG